MAATDGNKAHLAGVSKAATERFVTRLARGRIQFFSGALRRVAWHVAQDHAVYIITGSLGPLAVCAAWQLALRLAEFTGGKRPRVRVCATELEERGGRWTGEVAGEAMCGAAKARAVQRLAQEDGLDLRRSYAYGDRWSDRWMLESVGHAAAVNPSRASSGRRGGGGGQCCSGRKKRAKASNKRRLENHGNQRSTAGKRPRWLPERGEADE